MRRLQKVVDQERHKNQRGAYVHEKCVEGAGDDRVGVACVAYGETLELIYYILISHRPVSEGYECTR